MSYVHKPRSVGARRTFSIPLLVREAGTGVPFERREYIAHATTRAVAQANAEQYAREKGLEVGRLQ